MGAAIMDFLQKGKAGKLRVLSSMFDDDEMPVKHLFRKFKDMPMLERKALEMAHGRILDVGAGAGTAQMTHMAVTAQHFYHIPTDLGRQTGDGNFIISFQSNYLLNPALMR